MPARSRIFAGARMNSQRLRVKGMTLVAWYRIAFVIMALVATTMCRSAAPPAALGDESQGAQSERVDLARQRVSSESRDLRAGLEAASSHAADLTSIALLVAGGTIVAILQTSYLRPNTWRLRIIYLLFPVGWICLGKSIYYGSRLRAVYLAYLFSSPDSPTDFQKFAARDAAAQWAHLSHALVVFALWLTLYLAWWVFAGPSVAVAPPGARIGHEAEGV